MVLTPDILDEGKSCNGSWSWKQLKALGLGPEWFRADRTLISGWRQYLMGLDVPRENITKFIALKNRHLYKQKRRLAEALINF